MAPRWIVEGLNVVEDGKLGATIWRDFGPEIGPGRRCNWAAVYPPRAPILRLLTGGERVEPLLTGIGAMDFTVAPSACIRKINARDKLIVAGGSEHTIVRSSRNRFEPTPDC